VRLLLFQLGRKRAQLGIRSAISVKEKRKIFIVFSKCLIMNKEVRRHCVDETSWG